MAMVAPALHVSEEVKSTLASFAAAPAPAPAAAFLSVDAPSATITLKSVLAPGDPGTASLDEVFDSLTAASQNGTQPVLALVCKADAARGRSAAPWFCVSFIPEGVPPRQKMLLATAREELKRAVPSSLGVGPDYQVTELEELAPAAFDTWSDRRREDAMSSRELEVARVEAEANVMRMAAGGARVASMATVQFSVGPDLVSALHKLVPPRAPTPPAHTVTASISSSEDAKAGSPVSGKLDDDAEESKLGLESPAVEPSVGAADAAVSADTSVSSFAPATPLVEVIASPGDAAASPPVASPLASPPLVESPPLSSPPLPPPSPPVAAPPTVQQPELNFIECAVVGSRILLIQATKLDDSPAAMLEAMEAAVKKPAPAPASVTAPSPMRLPGLTALSATEPRYFVFTLTTPSGAPSTPGTYLSAYGECVCVCALELCGQSSFLCACLFVCVRWSCLGSLHFRVRICALELWNCVDTLHCRVRDCVEAQTLACGPASSTHV